MKYSRSIRRNIKKPSAVGIPPPSPSVKSGRRSVPQSVLIHQVETREKWALNGCPRCHGDIFLEVEGGEVLGHCLQCGFVAISTGQGINTGVL